MQRTGCDLVDGGCCGSLSGLAQHDEVTGIGGQGRRHEQKVCRDVWNAREYRARRHGPHHPIALTRETEAVAPVLDGIVPARAVVEAEVREPGLGDKSLVRSSYPISTSQRMQGGRSEHTLS